MHATSATKVDHRTAGLVAAVIVLIAGAGVVAASLTVLSTSGAASGVHHPTAFLTHFQETGTLSAATPNPVPARASLTAAAPSRLGAGSAAYLIDAGVVGHEAVEWTFSETVGMAVNAEIEIALTVEYTQGAATHTTTTTVYVESQAAAITGTHAFDLYWDAGVAAGITLESESQISQACTAVGACP
ncbi:MAG: hypothetical protein WB947_07305 [Thermoplasmata archaeon]